MLALMFLVSLLSLHEMCCSNVTSYVQSEFRVLSILGQVSLVKVVSCRCVALNRRQYFKASTDSGPVFASLCHAIVLLFPLIKTSSHTEEANGHVSLRTISNSC
jgi:hypothetical protein